LSGLGTIGQASRNVERIDFVVIEAGSDQTYAEHSMLLVLQCLKNLITKATRSIVLPEFVAEGPECFAAYPGEAAQSVEVSGT
jgi:hypothetical protein